MRRVGNNDNEIMIAIACHNALNFFLLYVYCFIYLLYINIYLNTFTNISKVAQIYFMHFIYFLGTVGKQVLTNNNLEPTISLANFHIKYSIFTY